MLERIVITLLAALAAVAPVQARPDDNIGFGLYGIQSAHWDCAANNHVFDGLSGVRFAFLYHTFGDDLSCVASTYQDPRPRLIEAHLVNASCQRNNRCGKYEFLYGVSVAQETKLVRARDAAWLGKVRAYLSAAHDRLIPAFRGARCLISPELESNLPPDAGKVILDLTKSYFPECDIVWSGNGNSAVPGYAREWHTENIHPAALCVTDLDGQDYGNVDLPAWHQASIPCSLAALWDHHDNCADDGPFKDPRDRTSCPTAPLVARMNAAAKAAILPPADVPPWAKEDDAAKIGCKSFEKVPDGPGGFILKASDAHDGTALLLPARIQARSVKLLKRGGVFDTAKWAGPPGYPDSQTGGKKRSQIWRFNKPLSSFPPNSIIHADGACFVLHDASHRID